MAKAKKEKILIIGGTGFIGNSILQRALKYGFHVDSVSYRKVNRTNIKKGVNYSKIDISNKRQLKKVSLVKYDYVVNAGGYINHVNMSEGGLIPLEQHFLGTVNLLECLDKSKLKKFIQIGSSDEYGNSFSPQIETSRENPISPYSLGKVASSHYLQMLYLTEKVPTTTLRIFLCYGPGQSKKRFLPFLISKCISDEKIKMTSGNQLRDFCYIDDVVDAIFLTLKNKEANGQIINIASGKSISLKELAHKVIKIIGKGRLNFGELPHRENENMSLYADINKAKKILKWSPKISLEEGLKKTIKFYKDE